MSNANVSISSVVNQIAAVMYKSTPLSYYSAPQALALNALTIYRAMESVFDNEFTRDEFAKYWDIAVQWCIKTNNDIKQFHSFNDADLTLNIMVMCGYVSTDGEGNWQVLDRWNDMMETARSLAPLGEKITDSNRRVNYVKGQKKRPVKNYIDGIMALQNRAYHVEKPMLDILNEVHAWYANKPADARGKIHIPAILKDEDYVRRGCNEVWHMGELYSEWKGDNRGRFYMAACFGPNPQSGDMARCVDSHNVPQHLTKGTAAYDDYFMLEMAESAGDKEWQDVARIKWVAKNPVRALIRIIDLVESNEGKVKAEQVSVPAKPFMYVRMCIDFMKIEEQGYCDCRISFGEDAKCSGTQILGILGGSEELMKATGLVVKKDPNDCKDPYMICLDHIKELVAKSEFRNVDFKNVLTRSFSKRPYMQIQYSGGVQSLVNNADFAAEMASIGITGARLKKFAQLVIDAVWKTLGARVSKMMQEIERAVLDKCAELGKAYFPYTHIDGFKVVKPVFDKGQEICPCFRIRYDRDTSIIFGNQKKKTGWKVKGNTPITEEFGRTFMVNFVQGIDALIARTVALFAKEDGIRGFTSIHDCFRCCAEDAPRLHYTIARAYKHIFIDNNPLQHLVNQIGEIAFPIKQKLSLEVLESPEAYFFTSH